MAVGKWSGKTGMPIAAYCRNRILQIWDLPCVVGGDFFRSQSDGRIHHSYLASV